MKAFLFFIGIICCSVTALVAQRGFDAAVFAGLNFSQIDGDDLAGFNKLGLNGGLRTSYAFKENMDVALELSYSQRGSSTGLSLGLSDATEEIDLKYIEIPVLFVLKDWYIADGNYYKVRAEGGFSYGNLFSATSSNSFFDERSENFNTNDISFVLGLGIKINEHVAFSGRYTRSLNRLYSDPATLVRSLLTYFFTFRTEYHF